MQYILTSQASAQGFALAEAGNARAVRQLEPGVVLCEGAKIPDAPVFLRHMCPAQVEVALDGTMGDIDALKAAFAGLLEQMGAEGTFSVQTRILEGNHPAYKRFDVNEALSGLAVSAGHVLDVKDPAQVVSVVLADNAGWLGISSVKDNLSGWAGGMRRFKWEAGQISRAEFKLLEALELFGIELSDGEHSIDLGAAPGGWTRILRRRGLFVVAVDPAALDDRLKKDKRITHYRGTAQAYFRGKTQVCDIMVNDMKMDSHESAMLMVQGAECLRPGGSAVLTLKLPEDTAQWEDRLADAVILLDKAYEVAGMRQLFHNRNEVTAHLIRK